MDYSIQAFVIHAEVISRPLNGPLVIFAAPGIISQHLQLRV